MEKSLRPYMGNKTRRKAILVSRRLRHYIRLSFRSILSHRRALPDFLIIGAQKSGTSSLYAYLTSHPQISPAAWKEVDFFGKHYAKGVPWYRAHFPLSSRLQHKKAITGEASPNYLYHPCAAKRIAEVIPRIKLVVLLRNPVDRTISHYWHQVQRAREDLPLEEALEQEDRRLKGEKEQVIQTCRFSYNHEQFSYLDRSKYKEQLTVYDQYFDRDQILVLRSEDLFQQPQTVFDEVTAFLGLEKHILRNVKPRNAGSYPDTSPSTRRKLERFFQPYNQELYDYLGVETEWWQPSSEQQTTRST